MQPYPSEKNNNGEKYSRFKFNDFNYCYTSFLFRISCTLQRFKKYMEGIIHNVTFDWEVFLDHSFL